MEARDNRHNFEVGTSGTCSRSLTNPPLRSRVHRYPSDHIPAAGMAHRIVQFTDGHFSKERSLLPLVYSWAMIEGLQAERESPTRKDK